MTVRLPAGKTLDDGPFPTLIEYSGYQVAAPHDLLTSVVARPAARPNDPLAPATSTAVGSLIAPAARLRRRQRADARLGLLGRRLRPLRPARRPTTATTRSRPSPRSPGSRAARSGWPASPSRASRQLFAAGTRPPHLAAIAPMSVTDDLYTGTGYPGGIFNSGFAALVDPGAHATTREPAPERRPALGQERSSSQGDQHCIANQRLRLQTQDALDARLEHNPYRDPSLFDERSPGALGRAASSVPTFLVGQFQDEQTGGHFAESLGRARSNNQHVWLTLQNGVHADSLGPSTITRWVEFLELYVADEVPVDPGRRPRPERRRSTATSPTRAPPPVEQSRFAGMHRRRRRARRLRAGPARPPADGQRRRPGGPGLDRRDLGARLRRVADPRGAPRPTSSSAPAAPSTPAAPAAGTAAYVADPGARPRQTLPGDGDADAWKAQPPYDWRAARGRQGPRLRHRAARAGRRHRRAARASTCASAVLRARHRPPGHAQRDPARRRTRPTSRTAGCAPRTASSARRSTALEPVPTHLRRDAGRCRAGGSRSCACRSSPSRTRSAPARGSA